MLNRKMIAGVLALMGWVAVPLMAADKPAAIPIKEITTSEAAPTERVLVSSADQPDAPKPASAIWIWDDSRRDVGQTFVSPRNASLESVSIFVNSSENLGGQPIELWIETYASAEEDVAPTPKEPLVVYSATLPDDFDEQAIGRWVTFHFERKATLKSGSGYGFRLAFVEAEEYTMRRLYVKTAGYEKDDTPINAFAGHVTHHIGNGHYITWGPVEDLICVIQSDR